MGTGPSPKASAVAFVHAIGKWTWAVASGILAGILGLLDPFGFKVSPWWWAALLMLTVVVASFVAFHRLHMRLVQRNFRDMVLMLKQNVSQFKLRYVHAYGSPEPFVHPDLFATAMSESRNLFAAMNRSSLAHDLPRPEQYNALTNTAKYNELAKLENRLDHVYHSLLGD